MNARVYVVPLLLMSSTLHADETRKPPLAVAPFHKAAAKKHQTTWAKHLGVSVKITNSIGMKLKLIPAGEFMMGSHESAEEVARVFKEYGGEAEYYTDERPQHPVRITRPFYLGAHEVTVGQFRRFVEDASYRTDAERDREGGYGFDSSTDEFVKKPEYTWRNPGFSQADSHPVVNVSWNDALAFCRWLSRNEAKTYRLPTEAEWEYACRGGTESRYWFGDDPKGLAQVDNVADGTAKERFPDWTWCISAKDSHVFTAPVGTYRRNPFGLYDTHGNVSEWCSDWYAEDYCTESPPDDPDGPGSGKHRVIRGGSWLYRPYSTRSAYRDRDSPDYRNYVSGFRLARTL